ncbi:ATP-binding protein [Massilia pinisoli]|uniref:histidine kinase n=1 Tax=Massilia pinisoli TaxID=1772194 RepID=A0ABT1ZKZ6_9BURK|nr:ATP-binding protein [Massilia pinisoli]MCS0580589.1 ATP-binding protein [Massilia pinisoli]
MPTIDRREQRVLIVAPHGRDADVIAGVVARDGVDCEVVAHADALVDAVGHGAAAAIVAEEALSPPALARLSEWLGKQESWSDFPFVVLLAKRFGTAPAQLKATLGVLGNVILLERPLSADTLATAAASALRARRRQYEAREVLAQRAAVAQELASLNAHLEARVAERTRALARANDRLTAEIMERERAEQAMAQAQKLEFLGRFTGGIAHDFNNLLNVIQGNMELIGLFSREDMTRERARTAQAACRRGAKLTSQLLSFARNQVLDLHPLPVRTLFENVAELAKPILGSGITLSTSIGADVDAVLADTSQMEMALLNLVINARDAMKGRGAIDLRAACAQPPAGTLAAGAYVCVTVSDDGPGMSPEIAAKVFEPFFTTKGVGKGTGLGLSQVYGMAQQSGGGAFIRSAPGQGATVEIWLRAAHGDGSHEGLVAVDRQRLAGLKVLVVEDDGDVRAGIVDALLALGCNVSQAGGAVQGLAALACSEPGLLLTDYLMPDMTGVELAIRARELFPRLPVLVATGYADMDAIENAIGTHAVLRKPFQLAELSAAVNRVVNLA